MTRLIFACGLWVVLSVGSSWAANLTATEFETTPVLVETFAGGTPVGKWELDPGNVAGAAAGQYVTSTPAGVNATVTALNPVGSSSDGACMMMGNPVSTNGSLFGLDYMRCINSKADSTGADFTAASFKKYRVVASLYLFTPTQIATRWQVGPYLFGGADLFRACSFYNTFTTGIGPGFGYRGATVANALLPGTSALTTSRWTKMSVMVDATDADSANHRLSICVDANGDGTLNESDPLEYISLSLNSTRTQGPPGIFTVGDVNSDGFPLFIDTVEVYGGIVATSAQGDWTLYE